MHLQLFLLQCWILVTEDQEFTFRDAQTTPYFYGGRRKCLYSRERPFPPSHPMINFYEIWYEPYATGLVTRTFSKNTSHSFFNIGCFSFLKRKLPAMRTVGENNYKRCCTKCKNYEIGAYFEPFARTTGKTISCIISSRVPTQAHVPCGTVCKRNLLITPLF